MSPRMTPGATYDCYPATPTPRNAYLLRELVAVTETAPAEEGVWCWVDQVRDGPLDLKSPVAEVGTAGRDAIDPVVPATPARLIRSAAVIAVAAIGRRRTPIDAKDHVLARPILYRQADCLRFATGFRVPFDGHADERGNRMVRHREKVSGRAR
ncbi:MULTISPECIES: hypothetical protein [unclassified Streptomyces]|uniref:hypothetical protein n=1 Tax=unclassified Streptomyces TaxID=2593676 RepID=UPI003816ED1D